MLGPGLEAAGHTLVESLGDAEAMVDFTRPDAVAANVRAAVAAGVPCVVGTTGWETDEFADAPVAVFYAPNFAIGAVLMMRFAAEAARHLERAEIVELHHAGEARRAVRHGEADRRAHRRSRADPLGAACPGCSPTRRCCSAGRGRC